MLSKPPYCAQSGCPLATRGLGFAPADLPPTFEILFVGEALGKEEYKKGKPFVGAAGYTLDKILKCAGIPRTDVGIENSIHCMPPNDWLEGAPWEDDSIACCRPMLDETLAIPGIKVVVPMGGTAIRRILNIPKKQWKSYRKPLENFHGTIHRDPLDRFWVVPTFHPASLLHGSMRMFGVLVSDMRLAKEIATKGHTIVEPTLKVDPPIEWFAEYVETLLGLASDHIAAGNPIPWLANDIETPEKQKGVDESEIEVDDPSFIITRVNFASQFDTDFGVTVPWSGPYIQYIAKLLGSPLFRKVFWHRNYDVPRLRRNGIYIAEPIVDMMDGWHFLQSNLPKGLGFTAPFFSKYKYAWKHLSDTHPGEYAAWDGVQTIQCTIEIEKTLQESDQWHYFWRHGPMTDRYALKPAEDVGLLFDKDEIVKFQGDLDERVTKLYNTIKSSVPEELIPLEGKYKKQPLLEDGTPDPKYFKKLIFTECYKCLACEKVDVTPKHRCKERKFFEVEHGRKPFSFGEWGIELWFCKGEFNPNSPQQILGYIRYKGHKPGRAKKRKTDSADAAAIEKLNKKHPGDPVYSNLITLRKLSKVKSTYVDSAYNHMDKDSRVHTVFCLTGEHEILTKSGWIPLCKYDRQASIVQWDPTGTLKFVSPLDFTEAKIRGELVELSGKSINIRGTKNHRVPYYYRSSRYKKSLFTVGPLDKLPRNGRIPVSGRLGGSLSWSDHIALAVAIQADGCIEEDRQGIRFTLKRERKIIRLRQILDALGIKYSDVRDKTCAWQVFRFKIQECPIAFDFLDRTKTFKLARLLELTQEAKRTFISEVLKWDGHIGNYRAYFSTNKINIDIVQTLAHTIGESAHVYKRPITPLTRNICYQVTISKFDKAAINSTSKTDSIVNGTKVFCPTVPGEFFLTRYKGTIYITGNTNNPSTWRTSSIVFNTQNQISVGKREDMGLGKKFRRCVIASPGCYLLEFDFAGIEAVEVGYFCNSPEYIRLSKMSTHAFMTTQHESFPEEPAQLDWPDDKLREYLSYVKHNDDYKKQYAKNKVVVHSSGYGNTAMGLHLTYPELFSKVRDAQETLELFFGLFPAIKIWKHAIRNRAYKDLFIGGDEHPFRYKHWFFEVYKFSRITKQQAKARMANGDHCVEINHQWFAVYPGPDSKRCIAYLPQSTAGGILRESLLRLFIPSSPWYIGDVYYGKTPFRMPIHDSIVLEVPKSKVDMVTEKVYRAMTHPVIQQPCPDEWGQGDLLTKLQLDYIEETGQLTAPRDVMERTKYLSIGLEGEIGTDWGSMSDIDLGGLE